MTTIYEKDLADYLAEGGKDPGALRALALAISRDEAAAAAPAEKPVPVTLEARPTVTSQEFLSDQLRDEMRRRSDIETQAILDQPRHDAEAAAEKFRKDFGRAMIGRNGASRIDGSL